MVEGSTEILRSNERALRRCTTVDACVKNVPSIIVDPAESGDALDLLGESEDGKRVFKFKRLSDSVFYLPGFISDSEIQDMSLEILNGWIDFPRSNSLQSRVDHSGKPTSMWAEYMRTPDRLADPSSLQKLRWACVGYHYNWTDRTYSPEDKSPFPPKLANLYQRILALINSVSGGRLEGDPQSAIVNFYHSQRIADRLGGHRDDVESTDHTPLVSISLGLPGVFLLESESMILRSGDVVVLADTARQSLHGVPCIIHGPSRKAGRNAIGQTERECVSSFLNSTRISISVRQVY